LTGNEKDIMDIDNITYEDLSLYSHEEEFSIFHRLDFTRTTGGKDLLLDYFNRPFSKLEPIQATQRILTLMLEKLDQWPSAISNGTIMVMERFYETALDTIPQAENLPAALSYKLFHGPDYSMVRYSVGEAVAGPGCAAIAGEDAARGQVQSHPGHSLRSFCPGEIQNLDAVIDRDP